MGAGINRENGASENGGSRSPESIRTCSPVECKQCCAPASDVIEVVEMDYGVSMGMATSEETYQSNGYLMKQANMEEEELCHFDFELAELKDLPTDGMEGPRKLHRFRTGATYKGQWLGNARHGFGVQVWPDGSRYEGQWSKSAADGLGRFTFDDGDVYIGSWKLNKFHGLGTYYNLNNTVYYGEWVEGQRQGYGTEVGGGIQANVEYSGCFAKGHKDGPGLCKWPDGSEYQGEWCSNQITGNGAYYSAQGSRLYKGQWLESAKHGTGSYSWPDGRSYCGQYSRDRASGFGIFVWPDGSKYEGEWQAAKQHGIGRYVEKGGEPRELRWAEGRPVLHRRL